MSRGFVSQVADITYGGRVTDTWDKRAISSILRKYFDPQLMEDDFMFTDQSKYYAPQPGSIEVYTVKLDIS